MSSEIKMLQHLKLEKGSVVVVNGDIDRHVMESLRKAIEFMELDFKVPIIGLGEDADITLATRDEVVAQLDKFISKETVN